eukprot:2094948-Heterocapsa_arctica.AAC.1
MFAENSASAIFIVVQKPSTHECFCLDNTAEDGEPFASASTPVALEASRKFGPMPLVLAWPGRRPSA